jgi:putative ATP-binding cassette transporter
MKIFQALGCLPLLLSVKNGCVTSAFQAQPKRVGPVTNIGKKEDGSQVSATVPSQKSTLPHGRRLLVELRAGSVDPSPFAEAGDPPKNKKDEGTDWKYIGRQASLFRQMALPYYAESTDGRWLLAGLLALTLLNSGVSVVFSYLGKDFWNALSSKDTTEFYTVLQRYLGALLVGAPVVTLYRYQREQLAVHWREWMTARTFQLYTTNRVYYNLERNSDIDNPDQRISEDVNTFTSYSLQLVITVLTSLIDLASFSTILWGIYPQLFGAILIYATAGTLITTLLGQSLVGLNFFQLQREADLRYALVRLRDNAESIAFYAGEDLEGQAIERRLEGVMDNTRSINAAQRNLEFFVNSYRYLVQILPVAVVAPKYFAGEIALGVISQSVGAFNHILSDLSIIINQFERLSSFSAGIDRLSSFYSAMRDADMERNSNEPLLQLNNGTTAMATPTSSARTNDHMANETATSNPNGVVLNGNDLIDLQFFPAVDIDQAPSVGRSVVLAMEHLALCTPDRKRTLVHDLTLQLREGENLLIVGNSGAGKSSLLRGIAGLWTVGAGRITRPPDEEVYFLPQRPYCTLGSLKDQLLYPAIDNSTVESAPLGVADASKGQKIVARAHWLKQTLTDDDLLDILAEVDLLEVARRAGDGDAKRGLCTILDWTNVLSLGEQQRLAFGRLLVNRPRLVILDEAVRCDISIAAAVGGVVHVSRRLWFS